MTLSCAVLGLILLISAPLNVYLFARLRQAKKKPAPTYDAQDLLHDLTQRGQAVLRVQVIDAANLMLRSPRG